jgi:ABC-type transport system involved in multi-copper enzyme maturation permease subunit
MRRIPLLTGMALRDLWISYRLLATVGLLVVAAAPALLLPRTATAALADAPPGPLTWYAAALALALGIAAALSGWSLAGMRHHGAAAWLAVRAVPRASILLGWFVAAGIVVIVGAGSSALLAWLVMGGESGVLATSAGYAATVAAVAAGGLLAVAAGLVMGSVVRPALAALTAGVVCSAAGLASAAGLFGLAPEPLGGLAQLAHIELQGRPTAMGMVSTGLALAGAAVLLAVASAALERADL